MTVKNKKSIILFPPNWSACVNGPHLALPLLAGAGRGLPGWDVEIWDLSAHYYNQNSTKPFLPEIIHGALTKDYSVLDELYFAWEDSIISATGSKSHGESFRLLSGYSFPEFSRTQHLTEVLEHIKTGGTIFTDYYNKHVLPRMMQESPEVVGITISSSHQIVPSLELLIRIREHIPDTFVILGGNVVTRLRASSALEALRSLSDQIVLFQGELAFHNTLQSVAEIGVKRTRNELAKIVGDQLIPIEQWPTPLFDGIDFNNIVGLPVLSYASARGCYWGRCHFCGIPAGWASTGFGGSAPAPFVVEQMQRMIRDTGIPRIKFVDESMAPGKVRDLCYEIAKSKLKVEWEAYTRLEPAWEDVSFLEKARKCGLRKLYFGLEQAPSASRVLMNKQDSGDPLRILHACHQAGVAVHLFCMVGYPGTSREDAELTTKFLLDNQHRIDTADLAGFRLDRGTSVPGIRSNMEGVPDWALSLPYVPLSDDTLSPDEVVELEGCCQETLWQEVPQLLHPLYRLVSPWANETVPSPITPLPEGRALHVIPASNSN